MGRERHKTRQLAIEAVFKALAIISGDSSHDLFTCPCDGGGTPEDTPARVAPTAGATINMTMTMTVIVITTMTMTVTMTMLMIMTMTSHSHVIVEKI